ncbi:MAG TPA: NAD(P)/FAD-dependent oxidoreductase [Candidatus Acidoferrales bacterium]|nr:NAD(P)/FAD-dependent oxidoreductase [Candidatus Acidoferrales bacterium]
MGTLILGAGPAGLTAAYELHKLGLDSTVLEADPRYVGGIARTIEYHGYRFDIGGHRFFSKNSEIESLWTEILGAEMLTRRRLSRIYYRGRYFDYPLRAMNAFWGLGPLETARCILSYAVARARPVRPAASLEDWVSNQFGKRLFGIFFKTYTEKVWGIPTSELSADWAAQRIKGLSLPQVLREALLPKRFRGDGIIKTLVDQFRYPRLGPGQMWDSVTALLRGAGHEVLLDRSVTSLRWRAGRIEEVVSQDSGGGEHRHHATEVISSLPLRDLVSMLDPAPPEAVLAAARALSYRDFLTVGLITEGADLFPDNWIYVHDPDVKVGRLQNFRNWSPGMVTEADRTGLGLEYFCFEGDGLWTMSDEALIALGGSELEALGLCSKADVVDGLVIRQTKAYPVYDDSYLQRVAVIREWLTANIPSLHLCGRNGMHKYNNQDHSMMTALVVARRIAGVGDLDPWRVNTDAEYNEDWSDGEPDPTGRQVPLRRPG